MALMRVAYRHRGGFLLSALPLVEQEPGTKTWFGSARRRSALSTPSRTRRHASGILAPRWEAPRGES